MSTGAIVGGIIGGIIGSIVPGVGTYLGFSLGASLGGLAQSLIAPPHNYGPTLNDLKNQTSSYGVDIPERWASGRQAGNVIWQTDLEQHSVNHSSKGGPVTTTYKYTFNTAIGVCKGPITSISRIWANKKVWYDIRAGNAGLIQDSRLGTVRVYLGTEDQEPDPLIEAISGPGTPAYRGLAYVVLEGVDGTETQGRIQWEFEVIVDGDEVITANNICSLTSADPGYRTSFPGRSWITDRKIYLWSTPSPTVFDAVEMFQSLDGQEKTYLGPLPLPSVNTHSGPMPVNTRDQFVMANVEVSSDNHQQLRLMFPYAEDGSVTLSKVYQVPQLYSSYDAMVNTDDTMTAYDQDSGVAAFATRIVGKRFGDRVTIFNSGGIVEYLTNPGVICALAAAAGNVYAAIYSSGAINLHVIRQLDGALIAMHPGTPSVGPSAGTAILDSIRTDGSSVWHWGNGNSSSASTGFVQKWDAAGNVTFLSDHVQGVRDDGSVLILLGGQQCYVGDTFVIMQGEAQAGTDSSHPIFRHEIVRWDAINAATVPLSTIVSDLCAEAGLLSGDIDVSELTDQISGYTRTKRMTSRAAIEPLQQAYFFDAVESDFKLKFIKRGTTSPITIPQDDRAAHEDGAALPDGLSINRLNELELPSLVDVQYVDASADYLNGSQYERRLTKKVKSEVNLNLPINLTADQAKQIAITNLYSAWLTQTYKWSTTRAYAYLEPTDLVALPTDSATYIARITRKTERPSGVIDWEAIEEDANVYTQTAAGTPLSFTPTTLRVVSATTLRVLDIPMLRDADNSLGPYAAVDANGPTTGAVIQKANDNVEFDTVTSLSTQTILGFTTTALGTPGQGNTFDQASSVTVNVGTDTLLSYTQASVLAGTATPYLIGNEIVYACTATLVSTGVYALSNLLRGLRGTERYKGTHAAGERFIVLQTAGMRKLSDDVSDLNVPRYYRAVTFGRDASTADETTLRDTGQALAPFAPVDLRVDYSTSPITVSWHRRSRFSGRFLATMQPTLGEATEKYEIDVKTSTGALVTTLTAYAPSIAISTYVTGYTATVYQISAVVGRGQGTTITL